MKKNFNRKTAPINIVMTFSQLRFGQRFSRVQSERKKVKRTLTLAMKMPKPLSFPPAMEKFNDESLE